MSTIIDSKSLALIAEEEIDDSSYLLENNIPVITSLLLKDEVSVIINNNKLLFSLNFLKKNINCQYSLLSCISGIDLLYSSYRFGLFYDLLSIKYSNRLRVKIFLNEITPIYTVMPIFINANWWEREIWDMFGIFFINHTELRRILTDYGFEGYPLRKDFPAPGYIDSYYNFLDKKVLLNEIELSQDYRPSGYLQPW